MAPTQTCLLSVSFLETFNDLTHTHFVNVSYPDERWYNCIKTQIITLKCFLFCMSNALWYNCYRQQVRKNGLFLKSYNNKIFKN